MRPASDSERIAIVGHTGSGKSMEGLHQLSQRSFDLMPWIVVDLKGNDLVAKIPVTAAADLDSPPPRDPGLYVVRAGWEDCERHGRLDLYLRKVLDQGRTGVMIDEGQALGSHNRGLRGLLTRGRSAECPVIFVCQRPMDVDTFVFSESDYLQVFLLVHPDDHKRIEGYVPRDRLDFDKLRAAGDFHSYYYDVRKNEIELLEPCPPFQEIYDRFLTRLPQYIDPIAENLPRRARV